MDYSKEYFLTELTKEGADVDEIRKRYRKLTRTVHPDVNQGISEEPIKNLNNAYEMAMRRANGSTTERTGKGGKKYEDTYTYDEGLERFFMEIVSWLYATDWIEIENVEVIGTWIWIWNIPKGSPFVKSRAEGDAEIETLEDNRPCWAAADDRPLHFMYGRAKKGWYMDLRRYLTDQYDKKRRGSRISTDDMRAKYGSRRLSNSDAPLAG